MLLKARTIPLLVALALFPRVHSAQALVLSQNGQGQAIIVTAGDTDSRVGHAAAELSGFLHEVTGGSFPVVSQPQVGIVKLWIGPTAARIADPTFSTDGLGTDGMVIRTVGNGIILAGGAPRGTLYAVYSFLEDVVGCRWWSSTASTIPHQPTLMVNSLNVRYVPPFERREVVYADATNPDWSVRNRCVGEVHGINNLNMMAERGGCRKAWPTAHSFYIVLPPETYFAGHPEWYSLIDGVRTASPSEHASLCLTNEAMRQEYVRRMKDEVRWFSGILGSYGLTLSYTSIGYPDDSGFPHRCQCANCTAIEQAGNPSDLLIRFANAVAADIESEFPNIPVVVLAYHDLRAPPKNHVPRSNMVIHVSNIECSFSKPISDERNASFREDLLGWRRICNRVYLWDYAANFMYLQLPHPNLRTFGTNLKFCLDNGITGIYEEAITSAYNTEMAELRTWVLAKLMWDPNRDADALIDEFVHGYYGPAGDHVLAYLNVMHDAVATSGDWLGLGSPPTAKFLSFDAMSEGLARLQAAETAVQNSPELLARVRQAQAPVQYALQVRGLNNNVTAGASSCLWGRYPSQAIDGSGLTADGMGHGTNVFFDMFLSDSLAVSKANRLPGTVAGGHWICFAFDKVYSLKDMWIWNYNETPYTSMGFKDVTIQYSATGGPNPSEWQTIFKGQIPQASGVAASPRDMTLSFNGASVKYVVITTADGPNHNWSGGQYENTGLSEVRFAGVSSFHFEDPGRTIQGTVIPAGYAGDLRNVGVQILLRQGGAVVRTERMLLTDQGQFAVHDITPLGLYDVAIKTYGHLQRIIPGVALDGTHAADLGTVTLIGGDADGDDALTSADLAIVLAGMNGRGD